MREKVEDFGYRKGMRVAELVRSLKNIGFQATNLGRAAEIILRMKREKAKVMLAFTSNMATSGLRGLFAQLAEKRFAHAIITTAGSIEEDIIKTREGFELGTFSEDDEALGKEGINRVGNILVSSSAYEWFEDYAMKLLEEMYSEKKVWTSSEICRFIGKKLNNKKSFLYWAQKNNILVYCPSITDGSFGIQVYFFKQKRRDFVIDESEDLKNLLNEVVQWEKAGVIALGGGVSKHQAILSNILRGGMDYAVYITTASPYSGSLSGATTDEAKSWGKMKGEGDAVTVKGDATVMFPLAVSLALEKEEEWRENAS